MKYYTKYFLTPLKDSPSNDYFQTWLDGVITGLVIGKSCGYSPLIVEEFQKSLQTIIK
jgi:hypothetical protein